MKKPTSTAPSTDELDAAVTALLPSALADMAIKFFDERDAYQAGRRAGALALNEATGDRYRAAIEQALLGFKKPYGRHITRDIYIFLARYDPSHWGLPDIPSERTIRKYLKILS